MGRTGDRLPRPGRGAVLSISVILVFLLGVLTRRANQHGAMVGMAPIEREPLTCEFGGLTVCKTRPWGQGPVFLQQLALLAVKLFVLRFGVAAGVLRVFRLNRQLHKPSAQAHHLFFCQIALR